LDDPDFDAGYAIEEDGDKVFLAITLPQAFESFCSAPHNTGTLGRVRIVDADFEDFDGSFLELNSDYLDVNAGEASVSGPFGCLKNGTNRICVWE
jgi:hypothetical protein